jgi:hypothetical protein
MQLELTDEDLAMPVKKLADYYRDPRAKMLAEQLDRDYPTSHTPSPKSEQRCSPLAD